MLGGLINSLRNQTSVSPRNVPQLVSAGAVHNRNLLFLHSTVTGASRNGARSRKNVVANSAQNFYSKLFLRFCSDDFRRKCSGFTPEITLIIVFTIELRVMLHANGTSSPQTTRTAGWSVISNIFRQFAAAVLATDTLA